MKTHLKIGLKDWNFVSITWWRVFWRTEIKILALFVKRFWKFTQLHSYLNTPRILEESNFNFRYVRLWDLHISREKWLNYLQTVDTLIRCQIQGHLIWVCTVCQLSIYGSPTTIWVNKIQNVSKYWIKSLLWYKTMWFSIKIIKCLEKKLRVYTQIWRLNIDKILFICTHFMYFSVEFSIAFNWFLHKKKWQRHLTPGMF